MISHMQIAQIIEASRETLDLNPYDVERLSKRLIELARSLNSQQGRKIAAARFGDADEETRKEIFRRQNYRDGISEPFSEKARRAWQKRLRRYRGTGDPNPFLGTPHLLQDAIKQRDLWQKACLFAEARGRLDTAVRHQQRSNEWNKEVHRLEQEIGKAPAEQVDV